MTNTCRFQTHARAAAITVTTALLGLAATSCSSDSDAYADTNADRPTMTITASDTDFTLPSEVPSGLVDVELRTDGSTIGHHLLIARLNDGVTLQQVKDAEVSELFDLIQIKGGNGTVEPGASASMTFEFEPGNYFIYDNPQSDVPPAHTFTVVDSDKRGVEPTAKGTVSMGPGMQFSVPDDFDGRGVWRFVNNDTTLSHESALVRLADGATPADVVTWAQTFEGPPPFTGEFGGMGALGPGEQGWMDLEPGEPGDYALICFVPGPDGRPHVMLGMVAAVTVRA